MPTPAFAHGRPVPSRKIEKYTSRKLLCIQRSRPALGGLSMNFDHPAAESSGAGERERESREEKG